MRTPEEALALARQRAAAKRAGKAPQANWSFDDPGASTARLTEWALIEPDEAHVYSTRPLGAPITALKRLMIRLLHQYLNQLTSQQSRFNAQIVTHLIGLEERVQALEEILDGRPPGRREEPPDAAA